MHTVRVVKTTKSGTDTFERDYYSTFDALLVADIEFRTLIQRGAAHIPDPDRLRYTLDFYNDPDLTGAYVEVRDHNGQPLTLRDTNL